MKKFLENLANLIKVKTLITLIIISVFAVLSIRGTIDTDNIMLITGTVIAFYFGTVSEKNGGNNQ